MDFNSISELKDRVDFVLEMKEKELKSKGYNISKDDIWFHLSKEVFPNVNNLTLYDVVKYITNYEEEK